MDSEVAPGTLDEAGDLAEQVVVVDSEVAPGTLDEAGDLPEHAHGDVHTAVSILWWMLLMPPVWRLKP